MDWLLGIGKFANCLSWKAITLIKKRNKSKLYCFYFFTFGMVSHVESIHDKSEGIEW